MQKDLYYKMNEDEADDNRWFKARKDIILGLIKKNFKHQKDISILDVGSGTGYLLENLLQSGYKNIRGFDCSKDSIHICKKKGIHIEYGMLPHIEGDKKYDCITCLDVIEHIDEDKESIESILMHLEKDGKAIFTVPAYKFLRGYHDEVNYHKRRYTLRAFEQVLKNAGGNIEYISYYNFFLFPVALLFKYINKKSSNMDSRMHGWINRVFYRLFKSEFWFLKRGFRLPFGVSLIAVVRKN